MADVIRMNHVLTGGVAAIWSVVARERLASFVETIQKRWAYAKRIDDDVLRFKDSAEQIEIMRRY